MVLGYFSKLTKILWWVATTLIQTFQANSNNKPDLSDKLWQKVMTFPEETNDFYQYRSIDSSKATDPQAHSGSLNSSKLLISPSFLNDSNSSNSGQ